MASLDLNVPHDLSQQEALTRIKSLLTRVQEEQKDKVSNVKETWNNEKGNFEFTAQGFDISGTIDVQPANINIHAEVPFIVSLFKGKIQEMIDTEAKKLLTQ